MELAADKMDQLAGAYETQLATNGQKPTLSAVFLGSPFLSEDLTELAKGVASAEIV